MTRKVYTTHTTRQKDDNTTKQVVRAPRTDETPAQRRDRLYAQAAQNGCRVQANGDGSYTVPSQRIGADGQPLGKYRVEPLVDGGLSCPCTWGEKYGPYTDDNPLGCCAHTAKVALYLQRKAAAALRAIQRQQDLAA